MTEKQFEVYKVSGNFGEWEVEDTLTDTVVMDNIMHKYLADRLCEKLNELSDENEQLKYDNTALKGVLDTYRGQAEYHQKQLEKENEQLKNENEKLTKALLFFMDVTYVEISSNWYESMDTACQKIFKKSYDEIHKIYKGIGTDEEVFKLFEGDFE